MYQINIFIMTGRYKWNPETKKHDIKLPNEWVATYSNGDNLYSYGCGIDTIPITQVASSTPGRALKKLIRLLDKYNVNYKEIIQ